MNIIINNIKITDGELEVLKKLKSNGRRLFLITLSPSVSSSIFERTVKTDKSPITKYNSFCKGEQFVMVTSDVKTAAECVKPKHCEKCYFIGKHTSDNEKIKVISNIADLLKEV